MGLEQQTAHEAQPRGATPCPKSGVATESARRDGTGAAERNYPTSEVRGGRSEELSTPQEQWLHWCRRAERSYSTFKVRRGDSSKVRSSG